MFHITFALIPYFDWLLGRKKGKFSKIILQNLFFRNCLGNFSQIRTLVATATYSFHRLKMGKVKLLYFCSLIGDIGFFFSEMSLDLIVGWP